MRMQKGEWTQVYDLVPNKTISVKHYDELITELTLLRKVAEAARGVFLGEGEHLCSEFENAMDRLRQALAELDKEGER